MHTHVMYAAVLHMQVYASTLVHAVHTVWLKLSLPYHTGQCLHAGSRHTVDHTQCVVLLDKLLLGSDSGYCYIRPLTFCNVSFLDVRRQKERFARVVFQTRVPFQGSLQDMLPKWPGAASCANERCKQQLVHKSLYGHLAMDHVMACG